MKTHRKGFEKQQQLEVKAHFPFEHTNKYRNDLKDKMNVNRGQFGLHKQIDTPILNRW